jgi:hypothetical protein
LLVTAVCAAHLVAAVLFDKWLLAFVTLSNEGSRHGLLDDVSQRELVVFLSFFTAERNVRLFVTKSTACLAALCVLAAEFLVDFDRRTFLLVVTEWTF